MLHIVPWRRMQSFTLTYIILINWHNFVKIIFLFYITEGLTVIPFINHDNNWPAVVDCGFACSSHHDLSPVTALLNFLMWISSPRLLYIKFYSAWPSSWILVAVPSFLASSPCRETFFFWIKQVFMSSAIHFSLFGWIVTNLVGVTVSWQSKMYGWVH